MTLHNKFENLFLNISSKAALSAFKFVGKRDKIAADKAAVDSMRNELNKIDIKGKIVIGAVSYTHLTLPTNREV